MKFRIIILAILLFPLTVVAQKGSEVPLPVNDGFKKLFPSATDVEWSMKEKMWEVIFYTGNNVNVALFTAEGLLEESVLTLFEEEFPSNMVKTVEEKYPGAYVNSVDKVTDRNKKIIFKFFADTDDFSYIIIFDETGNILDTIEQGVIIDDPGM